ncbi:hypothetical protein ABZY58_11690 [Micromonospora tulbaghiae]|uniref:hypothetical protein n=1 Tax=Micromonospora tulbaghiae TaxID=479978 RepID=UPI0033A530EC
MNRKSPFLASIALAEALAPVVPDGWTADGDPVGRPWADIRTPRVGVLAVSEQQTGNTWAPLLEMCDGPLMDAYPGLEPMDTFVALPRGKIERITSSARTVKGAPFIHCVLDQTEEWVPSNGGLKLFETVKNNTAKTGGSFIESPNAFIPGEGSVAEQSASFWAAIKEGRAKDDGLYYDHREAPATTDLTDRKSLLAGLRLAYGDSSKHPDGCVLHEPACPPGHVDLDVLIATIWDTTSDEQVSRSDFLNQITHASDSWITQPEWRGCLADPMKVVADKETITLGFDGSRSRANGRTTDATALIACRVSDGHIFEPLDKSVWEQPAKMPIGEDGKPKVWEVPVHEVVAAVHECFRRYNVVGFFADPAKWETYIADWEAKYGGRLKVKSTREHPIEWWMTGGRSRQIVQALQEFHNAVVTQEMTHDGSYALTRHVLHARRRYKAGSGMQIAKPHPDSAEKIDAAVAAVLAWQARMAAVAAGVETKQRRPYRVKRLR